MATLLLRQRMTLAGLVVPGRRRTAVRTAMLLLMLMLSGCTSLFFYPMKPWVQNPARLGLDYQDVVLIEHDGLRIDGWWLPARGPVRGTVYYLHGNAQNISTHVMNVAWLPAHGYQVFLIDYRGYGLSDGKPGLPGAFTDIQTGLDWLYDSGRLHDKPLIVFGESLGASMTTWVMSRPKNRDKGSCVILDAGFSGYRKIVNDTMKRSWLLWPLRPLVVPFIPTRWDPDKVIADISPRPLLILHSKADQTVPYAEGRRLYAAADQPKDFITVTGPHIAATRNPVVEGRMLAFMRDDCGAPRATPAQGPVRQF